MGVGSASIVSWGFVIPPNKLYSLLKVFRKLADQPDDESGSEPDPDPSKPTEEPQQPPSKKAKLREIEDWELDELLEHMEAARDKADKELPEDAEFDLREITCLMRTSDQQAGDTIVCYYAGAAGPPFGQREYVLKQAGGEDDYEANTICLGRTLSLERIMKDIPEETSETLRKVFHLKEAGIEVQDQWILVSTPF